ncbi:MAG: LLM class F420-dependent oxidoreductase [Acidimicrobiia bacterium]
MRFGIKTAPQHTTWNAMLDVWRAADDIELFESAWNFDHFYPIFSDSTGPCLEGWTMLAAMAQATRRLRLGCQVTGMIYRHPAVLANMAATIDVISDGRLELGLGAGWNQEECDAYGIPLPPLRERFDRFDEGVEAIVLLLSQVTSTLDGRYVQLRDARCEPKPVQRPHPPVTIGGNGPTRTLRTVARFAQQWNSTAGIQHWPEIKAVLAERCDEIGRDPATIECSVNLRHDPTQDVAALAESAAAFAAAGADIGIVYLPVPHTAKVLEPIAEALRPLAD